MTRKNDKKPVDLLVYGKVPPQAPDIEDAILGAIMLESHCIDIAIEMLTPESFYKEQNKRIFQAFMDLQRLGSKIDMLTVVAHLEKKEEIDLVGGAFYIAKLTNNVVSGANIVSHCRIVFERWMKRELIRAGGVLITEGYEHSTDAFDSLDKAEATLYAITNKASQNRALPMDSLLVKVMYSIQERIREAENELFITGVPTGSRALNKLTHGWQNTDIIVLAARPSVGKTALALKLARGAATDRNKPTPVAFFSLEMSAAQLTERILSAESTVPLERIKRGKLSRDEQASLFEATKRLANVPIHIDDTPSLNIYELRAKCRRMKAVHKVGLIILDYLQLMNGTGREQNREREIADISRGLKQLAKELDVPIIALSQLSRDIEKRKGGKPQLSDLRESGAIEQDADVVVFISRPDAWNPDNEGETNLTFAKHRNGTCETVNLKAMLWIQDFRDMETISSPIYNGKGLDVKKNAANDRAFTAPLPAAQVDESDDDPF